MDPGDQITSLEEFKTWKTDNLQHYLTMRGLTKEGTKDELVALCFSAAKLGLPVKPTQSEVLLDNVNCYNRILYYCDIPDPLTLHSGWFDEKSGISKWPPTFLSDISTYLIDHGDIASLSQVLKDYKVGKSYEYFTCGWLQEVFYHPLDRDTCLLKAKCCPSQRIRNDLHNVWVCIKKSDGSIKGAYCSCTAGLGQTCNHVASLLFKLESSNRYGMGACTSSACSWVVPKKVKDMQPKLLASMPPRKSNRSKSVKSRTLMPTSRKSLNPITSYNTYREGRNFEQLCYRHERHITKCLYI
ncbi:uncharacterized protein [Mytilus edulis]|uniref:uncharacterized protein n=1 Tax=Mytilus edulis TaxID=6550 RepID=UPI0039F06CA8